MIELEDWQARPSAPPPLALLKETLAGTGPAIYRIGGKFYLDEREVDRWLARKRARPDKRVKSKPTFPANGPRLSAEALERLYAEALNIIRPGQEARN